MSELALEKIEENKRTKSPYLDLENCRLTELPIQLLELTHLKTLSLLVNQISDYSLLEKMIGLKILNIGSNQISDYSFLEKMKDLKTLNVSHSGITDIRFLENLTSLQTLYLSGNKISDIKALVPLLNKGLEINLEKAGNTNKINLYRNPINNPPLEIVKRGREAIINFFEQIEKQGGTEPTYEARLLIVGEPGAGKTSLMNKLIDPTYEVYENKKEIESTVGINIHEGWSFPFKKDKTITFKANLWDFGGQEIQYMTHQFFLSGRVLYVLVADNRTQNTNFPYWFEAIHLFGKDSQGNQSPILVVLNENQHKSITNYDHDGYCERYKDTKIEYLNVDLSKNDARFDTVYKQVQSMLSELPHIGEPLPKLWNPIREKLKKLSKTNNHITDEKLNEICIEEGIDDKPSIKTLSTYLHDLGIILNFSEDRNLRDFIVLNPEWAVDAVYCILKDDRVDKNTGRFDEKLLSELWDSKYTKTEQKNLLGLMMKDNFEICYEYTKGKFIAPQFLKDLKTDFGFDNTNSLKFQFHYSFMPKGILTRLIVRLNEFIAECNGQSLVSKKNVIFEKDGCQAWVNESDFENKGEIRIEVNGKLTHRREVMWWIRNEIRQIHKKWFNSLEPKQFVPCNCHECKISINPYFFDFDYLIKCIDKHKEEVSCQESLYDVKVLRLLDGIYLNNENDFLYRLERKIDKGFEGIRSDIQQLNSLVTGLSETQAQQLNDLINQQLKTFKTELPQEVITEWKKATKSQTYLDNKDKLKLTLPIIPKILVYEKELSTDSFKVFSDLNKNINAIRRGEMTFSELFIKK